MSLDPFTHARLFNEKNHWMGSAAAIYDQTVTWPAVSELWVNINFGHSGFLTVMLIQQSSSCGVTIRDLLQGIYDRLQIPLTQRERSTGLQTQDPQFRALQEAEQKRRRTSHFSPLKRMDCLGDYDWWWGSKVEVGANHCMLHVATYNPNWPVIIGGQFS